MAKRQMTAAQLRNLPQYKEKSDEELERIRDEIIYGDLEKRIDDVVASFEDDFDLSNMTVNDMLSLRELARIFLQLKELSGKLEEAYEQDFIDVLRFEKLNRIVSQLRDDASKIQRDLNITRRAREERGEQSVVDFIEDLKARAKQFLQERLFEIYCPKCKMLLCKAWFLYPKEVNTITLTCGREVGTGMYGKCGKKFTVTSAELSKTHKNVIAGPPI